MNQKLLTTRFFYLDDDANSVLCDLIYTDGQNVFHKVIKQTRYAMVLEEDIEFGYDVGTGMNSIQQPKEFVENFHKKYFGTYFYASVAEMLNPDEFK